MTRTLREEVEALPCVAMSNGPLVQRAAVIALIDAHQEQHDAVVDLGELEYRISRLLTWDLSQIDFQREGIETRPIANRLVHYLSAKGYLRRPQQEQRGNEEVVELGKQAASDELHRLATERLGEKLSKAELFVALHFDKAVEAGLRASLCAINPGTGSESAELRIAEAFDHIRPYGGYTPRELARVALSALNQETGGV